MNYDTHYNNLISTRLSLQQHRKTLRKIRYSTAPDMRNNDTYFENHHITPKCLGGGDGSENLILLTAREHYIAHWLLSKLHPNTNLVFALWRLAHDNKGVAITSRKSQLLKQEHSKKLSIRMKGNTYNVGRVHSDEYKQVMSNLMSGENNPMFGTKGELSPNYGKKRTKETREKMSFAGTGSKNSMYGKKHTKESLELIRKASTGRKRSPESILKTSGKNNANYNKDPWTTTKAIKSGLLYNWANANIIYDIWVTSKDLKSIANLKRKAIGIDNKLVNSQSSFRNMILWFNRNGNPVNHKSWVKFSSEF